MDIKSLKEEYLKLANATEDTINKEALALFIRLYHASKDGDLKFNYSIVDEVIANRRAIFTLDKHLFQVTKKLVKLDKIIREESDK